MKLCTHGTQMLYKCRIISKVQATVMHVWTNSVFYQQFEGSCIGYSNPNAFRLMGQLKWDILNMRSGSYNHCHKELFEDFNTNHTALATKNVCLLSDMVDRPYFLSIWKIFRCFFRKTKWYFRSQSLLLFEQKLLNSYMKRYRHWKRIVSMNMTVMWNFNWIKNCSKSSFKVFM